MTKRSTNRGRVWPREQIRTWIEDEGQTQRWVAEQLGCTNQSVSRLCRRFGIRAQRRGPRCGPGHPEWKGGRHTDKDGYVLVWVEDHPHRRKHTRYMFEHRLVVEAHLGRYLDPGEVIHHIDGNKQNNTIANLELFSSNADHLRHELTGRVPRWTEDGKRRIRAGVEKAAAIRRASRSGAPELPLFPSRRKG